MKEKQLCIQDHPCFGKEAKTGRIHLPIASSCNICCNFCQRSINTNENRPGVSCTVLNKEEAFEIVEEALKECPEIKVLGVAGPGDTLATGDTLDFFKEAKEQYPDLIRCMSTNGLLLAEKIEDVINAGIQTLTVTINSIVPETQAKICGTIYYHGKKYEGIEAAEILIQNQLEGVKKAVDAGIIVKINTVLIPEINGKEIEMIAKKIGELGVFRYNIIPLIPQYHFKDMSAPTCEELSEARSVAEKYVEVFRHCQHCRADAIGVPGKSEYGKKIYQKKLADLQEVFSHG